MTAYSRTTLFKKISPFKGNPLKGDLVEKIKVDLPKTDFFGTRSLKVLLALTLIAMVFSIALVALAASVCAGPSSGMVGCWRGEGNASDSVGGNNGTLQNGTTFAQGKVGQAFSFDGQNDSVTTNLDVQPSAMSSMTWQAWVYPTRTNHSLRQTIFSNDNGGYDRSVIIEAGTSKFGIFTGTGVWQPTSVDLNQWQHIAVVYTPGGIKFYKNGVEYSYGAAPTGQGTTNRFTIGNNPGFGSEAFKGYVDETSVYNRALSQEEVVETSNVPPTISNQTVTISEDNTGEPITLRATDEDGDSLNYMITALPKDGKLYNGVGTNGGEITSASDDDPYRLISDQVTYVPSTDYNGPDSFEFLANDGTKNSNPATVSITVTPVNDAPRMLAPPVLQIPTYEDAAPLPLPIPAAVDVDGDTLTYTVSGPQHGTLSGTAPPFTYRPNPDYNGADSVTIKANDGQVDSNPATVNITVNPDNDAPVAKDGSESIAEDASVPLSIAFGALVDDIETSDANLTYNIVSGPSASQGTLSGTGSQQDFTPAANYNGSFDIAYTVTDRGDSDNCTAGTGCSAPKTSAQKKVTVTVNSVNDAPVATEVPVVIQEDASSELITLDASDVDTDDSVTYKLSSLPTHGKLYKGDSTNAADLISSASASSPVELSGSTVTYVPDKDYNGSDTFNFYATDSANADSNVAAVSITVNAVSDAPTADDQSGLSTKEETDLIGTVTGDDVDGDDLTYAVDTNPAHGTVSISADGSFTYTPEKDYNGPDSFTFTASDGSLESDPATVSINVTAVNDAPTISLPGGPLNYPENDSATVVDPGATVADVDSSNFDTGQLTVTLTPPPSPSGSTNDRLAILNQGTAIGQIGVSGSNVTFGSSTNVIGSFTGGSDAPLVVTFNANATPAAVQALAQNITYENVSDAPVPGPRPTTFGLTDVDGGTSNLGFKPINVQAVNDAPVNTVPGAQNTNEDTALTFGSANKISISDVDAETFGPAPVGVTLGVDNGTLTLGSTPPAGVSISGNGTGTVTLTGPIAAINSALNGLTYTPTADYNGAATLTVTTNDQGRFGSVPGPPLTDRDTVVITVNAVNDAPVANGQSVTTPEDTAKPITLTGSDIDGDTLTTYTVVRGPTNGTLTGSGANQTYTPRANFNGTDTFTYKVNDGSLDSSQATVTITVSPVNDAPVILFQPFLETNEDTPKSISLNAFDIDGDTLTYSVLRRPTNGTLDPDPIGTPTCTTLPSPTSPVQKNCTASVTYKPGDNLNGPDFFFFKVSDGTADSSAPVNIFVTPVNDAPSFTKGADQTVLEDAGAQTVSGWATAISKGTSNEATQNLTFFVSNDNPGLFSAAPAVTASGQLTYTPAANAHGSATVTVYAKDDGGTTNGGTDTSATETFTITVTPLNDAPSFTTGSNQTVDEDAGAQTKTGWATAISTGPSDESGQTLDFIVTNDNNSLFTVQPTIASNGTLSYTPAAEASGAATVTVKLHDDGGTANGGVDTSAEQSFTITVNPVNDPPTASGVAEITPEETAKTISLGGHDIDGDTLSFSNVQGPNHGTLDTIGTVSCDSSTKDCTADVTYTPDTDFNGTDAFDYTVADGDGETATGTVTIQVSAVNDAPTIDSTSGDATANEGDTKTYAVSASDVDEGDKLTYKWTVESGSATISGADDQSSADVELDNNDSSPVSLKVDVSDGTVTTPTSHTFSIRVDNVAPSVDAGEDDEIDEGGTFSASGSFSDPGSLDTHTATVDYDDGGVQPLALNAEGKTFDLSHTYADSGTYTVRVEVTDDDGDSQSDTLMVTVNNLVPVAEDQTTSTNEDTATLITLQASDADGDDLGYSVVTGPQHGSLSGTAPDLTYTPTKDFNGTDSFTYKANDDTDDSNVAMVGITINPVNDTPVADDESATTDEDTAATLALSGTDVDGDNLTFKITSSPIRGALGDIGEVSCGKTSNTCSADVAYTPELNFNGSDSFTYEVSDGAETDSATATITVNPVNDAPVASNDAYSVDEDTSLSVAAPGVLSNDSDGDKDALSAAVVSNPSHGSLTLGSDGAFSYTPEANFHGSDSFTYMANDGKADSNIATVTITVNATADNTSPVAENDSYSVNEDEVLNITAPGVLENDTDAENSTLEVADNEPSMTGTIDPVSGPAHGTLILNADGSFNYTPDPEFNRTDTFTYKATDGEAESNEATVTITVTPVNDNPTISDISDRAVDGNTDTGNIVFTVGDAESEVTDLDVTGSSDNTTLVPSNAIYFGGTGENRTVMVTPAADKSGRTTITVTVTDPNGGTTDEHFVLTVRDVTKPVVECGTADVLWHKDDVDISCQASDEGSGLADPADAAFKLSTDVKVGTETDSASTGSRNVCDSAGNCQTAGPISGNKVDKKAPSVAITKPSNAKEYKLNETDTADYACQDGGSGVDLCAGPVADGSRIDTASVGQMIFKVDATDKAGNTASLEHTYSVVYDYQGFFQPVDNPPIWNSMKAGSAVEVRFALGGDQGTEIFAAGYPKTEQTNCPGKDARVDAIEKTVNAKASGLSYDRNSNQYVYTWKTDPAWANTCRKLTVQLKDGTIHEALFKLTSK